MDSTKQTTFIRQQITLLMPLIAAIKQAVSLQDKLEILNAWPLVQDYLKETGPIQTFLNTLNPEGEYVLKAVIAIGQAPIVLNVQQASEDFSERLHLLIQQLIDLEHFYQHLGGVIGYHFTILSMLEKHRQPHEKDEKRRYIHPEGLHLNTQNKEVRQTIRWGIETLAQIAEIYPVGGAGDRLNLIDEKSNAPLPAAMLPFLGENLLGGLIRDIQSREYLYFKLYGKQLVTPIAMMTSWEKNNHAHILNICRQAKWFGRPQESFFLFIQPLIPVLTAEGCWSLSAPLTLTLKPGGHGVIWKLAEDQGVFSWLLSQGRTKAVVRQINNPVAGVDFNLLSLSGYGCKHNKSFGFSSSERVLNSAEGIDVVIESQIDNHFRYCLTNVEYTDFALRGLDETPAQPGSPFSIYPTNTNILFVDIPKIQRALKDCPIPGQLINMKSKVPFINPEGHLMHVDGGRLESTMQNIADCLEDTFPRRLSKEELRYSLQNFITYNVRSKTISTTKKSYKPGESPTDTPEQAYYDILTNNIHLFRQECRFDTPDLQNLEDFIRLGPNCIILYHPALGPLYSIISQKIKQGRMALNSELQINLAEAFIMDLDLDGSLLIESSSPLGCHQGSDLLKYGFESRCLLHHVGIRNKGIKRESSNCFWKNQIVREEMVRILLHEGAELDAQNLQLEGAFFFEVPPFHRLTLRQTSQGELKQDLEKIQKPSWSWQYQFDSEDRIKLSQAV